MIPSYTRHVDATDLTVIMPVSLLLLSLLAIVIRSRRSARSLRMHLGAAHEAAMSAGADAAAARARGAEARTGEREAAWAATTAELRARRLQDGQAGSNEHLALAERTAAAAERRLDEVRDALSRTERELAAAERDRDAALSRIALLETEIAATDRELRELRSAPLATEDVRLEAALAEAASLRDRVSVLEHALATSAAAPLAPDPWTIDRDEAIARLREELMDTRARHDAAVAELTRVSTGKTSPGAEDETITRLEATLAVRDSEVRELEERLTTLAAARHAETARLNERIAALQHLYGEIEARDHRIADLEAALHDAQAIVTAGDRDPDASANGDRAALGSELRNLRAMLAVERERNVRLALRSGPASTAANQTSPGPATDPPTDVTLVKGIGRVIARILAADGITSLQQIAALTDADIARIGPRLPVYPGRIRDDRWVEQARRLLDRG